MNAFNFQCVRGVTCYLDVSKAKVTGDRLVSHRRAGFADETKSSISLYRFPQNQHHGVLENLIEMGLRVRLEDQVGQLSEDLFLDCLLEVHP